VARQLESNTIALAIRTTACSLLGPAGIIAAPTLAVGAHFLGEYFGEDTPLVQSIGTVLAHIFGHLGGDAAHDLLTTLDANANHDIERITAHAVKDALALARANRPTGIEHGDLDGWFDAWDRTLRHALRDPEKTAALFMPSEEPEVLALETTTEEQWWPAFRPTLLRWSARSDTFPDDLDRYLHSHLLTFSRRALDHLLRDDAHNRAWIAWQEQFLKAILQQGNRTLNIATTIRQELATLSQAVARIDAILQTRPTPARGSAPPPPGLFIGRDEVLADLRQRLIPSADRNGKIQLLTAMRGWPGVGKTTVAAALAHDPLLAHAFPDGLLWASLGQEPKVITQLDLWARELGSALLDQTDTEHAKKQLSALLRDKRMLLIIDDVWKTEHAAPFKVGGRGCSIIITTRSTDIARALAPTPSDLYLLNVLNDEQAFDLLRSLAPEVVAAHAHECRLLTADLEGLPLALQVAGRLLHAEWHKGFPVTHLLDELRTAVLMSKTVPADMDATSTLTVNAVLQRSTDALDPELRDFFAYLACFAPKPASFNLAAMNAVWGVPDPQAIASRLIDWGLLEPAREGRYQMHALLVLHAQTLLHA
jgi:hypothetical protein